MSHQVAQHQPQPDVPPDHAFNKGDPNFCDQILFRLESGYPVLCGLRRNQHPKKHLIIPEPKDGP